MRSMAIVMAVFTVICATGVALVAEDARAEAKAFRRIPIPEREHGYGEMVSAVLRTKAELDALLNRIREDRGWNDRKGFEEAIAKADVDFGKEVSVFLQHTEGSGSVRVTFEKPTLRNSVLTCRITREVPEIGGDDMAYYCFALAVSKADVNAVELHVHGREAIRLPIAER